MWRLSAVTFAAAMAIMAAVSVLPLADQASALRPPRVFDIGGKVGWGLRSYPGYYQKWVDARGPYYSHDIFRFRYGKVVYREGDNPKMGLFFANITQAFDNGCALTVGPNRNNGFLDYPSQGKEGFVYNHTFIVPGRRRVLDPFGNHCAHGMQFFIIINPRT